MSPFYFLVYIYSGVEIVGCIKCPTPEYIKEGRGASSTRGTEKLRYIESDRRNMRLYLDLDLIMSIQVKYINPRLPKTP